MNILAPVSSIMSTNLITVHETDKLMTVKNLFDKHNIHHVPVVRGKRMVGLISKNDIHYFLKGIMIGDNWDKISNDIRLNACSASEIMTTGIAKLEPTDRIDIALEIFKENLFHSIPVVEGHRLVGILTPYDIITALADKRVLS